MLFGASSTEQGVYRLSRKCARSYGISGNIFNISCRILSEQTTERSPLTVPTKRGQPAINRGRSSPIVTLANQPPVTDIFVPKQHRIERSSSRVFPPDNEVRQILADDPQRGRSAPFRV